MILLGYYAFEKTEAISFYFKGNQIETFCEMTIKYISIKYVRGR